MVRVRWAEPGDQDFVNSVFKTPEIYKEISDDGCPSVENFEAPPIEGAASYKFVIGFVDGQRAAVFMVVPWNHITYEVHTLILPEYRGREAVEMCRAGFAFFFSNTEGRKVVTHVPVYNRAAYALAYRAGMRTEGINKKSFLKNGVVYDQYIMGLIKEVEGCPQQLQ